MAILFSPTLAFTREAEGSGNSLLLNLTESHCIFKLNISTLILSCRFYESSAKSEEKTKSFLGIAISLKRSPSVIVPNISTRCAQRTVVSNLIFAGIIAKCWCNTQSIKTAAENAASRKKTISNLK